MTRSAEVGRENGRPIPMVDLRVEHAALEKEILDAVASVLGSGRFILGEPVSAFERQLAALCGARYGVSCNSGTDALWLAMRALGIGPGDAVLCPAYSFFASAATIVRLGARPIFCDIDAATFNLDPEDAIRRAEGRSDIKAVLSVDLFGRMCELGPLESLAKERGWLVVEDAAQAIGARDARGGKPGEHSHVACLSFYPTKNLGALGDAGGIVTSDKDLARSIESLRAHGETESGTYEAIGINSRLDAIQAAALSVKLPHLESWTESRQALANHYDAQFLAAGACYADDDVEAAGPRLAIPTVRGTTALPNNDRGQDTHSFHRYVVRVPAERREAVIHALHEDGIASEVYYRRGLHEQPALAKFAETQREENPRLPGFPETERATRESLALPLYPELAPEASERVVRTVLRALHA